MQEEGLERFSAYLAEEPLDPVYVLVDLVEEEFREDTIPRVIGPDRRALMEARRRRLFSDPTYGCSFKLGRVAKGSRNDRMLFTALTRPQRLTPWLQAIARNRVPLAGVHSLPMLTEQMLEWIRIETSPALVVTWQRAGGLRQTCFVDGRVKLSRLAAPHFGVGDDAEILRREVEKVHRYLVRHGLLAADQDLDVHIVSHSSLQEAIDRLAPSSPSIRYHFVSLSDVGRRLGIAEAEDLRCCDRIFVSLMARRVPRHQYAPAREIRAYALHRARAGIQAAGVLVLAGGLFGGGSGLADAYDAGRLAHSLKAQADLYRHRYDEARTRLPATPVEVSALQLAVETAERLRDARRTPDAMLSALSRCLDLQPGVRLESIDWSAGAGYFPVRQPAEASSLALESGAQHGTPGPLMYPCSRSTSRDASSLSTGTIAVRSSKWMCFRTPCAHLAESSTWKCCPCPSTLDRDRASEAMPAPAPALRRRLFRFVSCGTPMQGVELSRDCRNGRRAAGHRIEGETGGTD